MSVFLYLLTIDIQPHATCTILNNKCNGKYFCEKLQAYKWTDTQAPFFVNSIRNVKLYCI